MVMVLYFIIADRGMIIIFKKLAKFEQKKSSLIHSLIF